jgi:uncharacterized membrane protein YphA (DoxX/SURF4 family)
MTISLSDPIFPGPYLQHQRAIPEGGSAISPPDGDVRPGLAGRLGPAPHRYQGRIIQTGETNGALAILKEGQNGQHTSRNQQRHPRLAERRPAGQFRHLADRRDVQVAARVPGGLAERDHGPAQGQPAWLRPWFDFWINLQHPRATFFAYLVAAVETLIAVALIAGFARKITYLSAATFSLLIWATAEGFGGPYTSGAADIGTAVIYAVVFLGLLALSAYAGPARYSADYYLEQKISWWWRLAEVRRPAPAAPAAPAERAIPAEPAAGPPASVPPPRTAEPAITGPALPPSV